MIKPNKSKKPVIKFSMYWAYALIIAFLVAMLYIDDNSLSKEVSYSKFEQYVASGGVKKIIVTTNKNTAEAVLNDSLARKVFHESQYKSGSNQTAKIITDIPSADKLQEKIDQWQQEGKFRGEVKFEKSSDFTGLLWSFGPLILIFVFWFWMMRRMSGKGDGSGGPGGVFSVGKSKAKIFDKDGPVQVTFKDVAGLSEAKTEIEEIVEFLKNPKRYTDLGGKIPKGALLVGPPGTGKTLLAKAVAGEANVPFFSMSGSDFVEMFVGVGASRVRDLFRQAKEKSPCIVFIDEIDAVGRARGRNPNMGSNDERENTLNQLLTEMDGFGTNSGVIILAATNRADILDKALLRAGRFDRQIYVELPDLNDRVAIFKVHLRNIKTDDSVDVDLLARQTPGFSGADIANVCNEAALIAARHDKKQIAKEDFMAAIDRIIGGLEKRNKLMSEAERRATAIHEAGHATVMWSLAECDPVLKVTIVPRGNSLGATWSVPDEERVHVTNATLEEQLAGMLGGRIAEEVNYGTLGAGALSDLERATKMTYAMVAYYGMSKKIGPISYYDSAGTRDTFTKPFSEQTAHEIDQEVRRIMAEAYERAKRIIEEKNGQINAMADLLLEKETIYAEDIEPILGPSAQSAKQAEKTDGKAARGNDTPAADPKPENEEETRKI